MMHYEMAVHLEQVPDCLGFYGCDDPSKLSSREGGTVVNPCLAPVKRLPQAATAS
jgi:hypothetical protein